MEFTGERMVPRQAPLMLEMAHRARYQFAEDFCRSKRVLDFGCGAGYGSHMLASVATNVLGVDKSGEAIEYAQKHYRTSNLLYTTGEMDSIISRKDRFDVVVCFEVIEHLKEPQELLKGLASVMTGLGPLVISTPNGKDDQNPYHCHGWDTVGFLELLSSEFKEVKLYGQGVSPAIDTYRVAQQKALEQAEKQAEHIKSKNPLTKFIPHRIRKAIYAWLVGRKIPLERKWSTEDFPIAENMKSGEIIIAVCNKKQQ